MSMRTRPTPSKQRGAAAIEFALLALPLATLTFGTTEFGRALHQFNTITKSVRDAVRYQSTGTPGNTLAARCLALSGSTTNDGTSCSGSPLVPGLTLAMIAVADRVSNPATHNLQPTGRGVVNLVTVTVSGYPFTSMVPFALSSFTFGAISATMVQPL
jgi:Flp pilus assembly protein TadG